VAVASAGVTNGGGLIVPDDRQTLVYDLDGNLAFDGTWSYEWDGENRLKVMTMTNVATIPNPQRKRLEFGYDHMNRRISKVVKTWNGSSFTSPVTNLFVYDGWTELNTLHSSLCTYLWGQDLSGTMDGAGGVGGLLMVARQASPSTNCFVAFDGNGNVTALVNAVSGAVEARYEYSPYGEILRATGPLAAANPFRWSTKFWDEESGLVYYGYRYYSPELGRWIGRDPVEEGACLNLYVFANNLPTTEVDADGRWNGKAIFIAFMISITKLTGGNITSATLWLERKTRLEQTYKELNRSASTGRRRGKSGGSGLGTGVAAYLGLVSMEAMYRAMAAAGNLEFGLSSDDRTQQHLQSFFHQLEKGETVWAELDALVAAAEMTGGEASAALTAWTTFSTAGDAFVEFGDGL